MATNSDIVSISHSNVSGKASVTCAGIVVMGHYAQEEV